MDNVYVEDGNQEITLAKKEMKRAGIFFFVLLLLEIPLSFLISYVRYVISADSYYVVSILMTQVYLLIGALFYMLITKKKFTRDLQLKKYKVSTFFLSFLVLITAAPMATVLNLLSQFFAENSTSMAILEVSEQLPVWLGVMVVGFLPGFIEETLYRGIVYQAFRRRSILTGIVVSALSFGLMHMNFNQILYAIYLGVVFALLVEATGSLGSSMILHMVFNGMNTLYLYLLPVLLNFLCKFSDEAAKQYLDASGNLNMTDILSTNATNQQLLSALIVYLPMAIGGLILTGLLLHLIAKINGRDISFAHITGDARMKKAVKPVTVCLILGWIFCLVNAIMVLFA